jgi:predicted alpha-1,2-mannosidase
VLNSEIKIESNKAISGLRQSKSWASNQHVYFYMEFSEEFSLENPINKISNLYKVLNFNHTPELIVKVGISSVSAENAKENLDSEAQSWDFNSYKKNAKDVWSKALNKIEVKGKDENKLSVFYTALYHTMIAPNTFSDVNGDYRGMDQQIYNDTKNKTYTVFSLWDTFRAAHPLYTIIEQKKTNEFINTFIKHYKQGGRLPVWELSSNETDCMIGYHSVSVITDAYVKGIRDYDSEILLEGMKYGANLNHFGLASYKKYGYIRAGDEAESVSKTLEYAYDDWCIAEFAKVHNDLKTYEEFSKRAQSYKNMYDPNSTFMRARINGGWFKPFDPAEVNFNYTEANSWQYSLFAPQDVSGLISVMGGEDKFENRLDELFTAASKTTGRHQADITGLIGQYAHGNEPSHHMAYLYNFIEKPWKTQERVKQIIDEQYWNAPDGLSGNEDCGQMSAWFVLSASGFYSVTPGLDYYVIGAPTFNEVTYNLENGKSFTIKTKNLSNKNNYISSATLNGKPYLKSYLKHSDIVNGGELVFEMNNTPSKSFGIGKNNFPKSEISTHKIVPVPFINAEKKTFSDKIEIEIGSNCADCKLKYQINEGEWMIYTKPIILTESSNIKAIAINSNEKKSKPAVADFIKIKAGRSITLNSKYANQYAAEGKNALIDYLKGSNNFKTGFWQGYQGQDVEAIVDLGKIENVTKISTGFLQDIRSWIWFPEWVEYYASADGQNFKKLKTIKNDFSIKKEGSFITQFEFKTNLKTRYIKMIAKNFGDCPDWHLGAGGKTWIFVDEISIE